MTARATFSDGTSADVTSTATWSSSNTTVATPGASGIVQVLTTGQSEITATYQTVVGHLLINVVPYVLSPGGALTVNFSTSRTSADLLSFFTNAPISYSAPSQLTAQLYVGATLLGSFTENVTVGGFALTFLDTLSPSTYFHSFFQRIDLSGIQAGTAAGRIVLTISGGSAMNISTAMQTCASALECPKIALGHSDADPSGFTYYPSEVTILSVTDGR